MTLKTLPPPLSREDYKQVRFWVEKAYDEHCKRNDGETDGFATSKPNVADPVTLRTTMTSIRTSRTARINQSTVIDSQSLLGLEAYEYIKIEMLCDFEEFRFCDGTWKLERLNATSVVYRYIRCLYHCIERGLTDAWLASEYTPCQPCFERVSPTPGLLPNTPPANPASNAVSPTPGLLPNTPAAKPTSNANSAQPGPLTDTPAADSTASTVVSGLSNGQPQDRSPHAVPVALVDPFADGVITKHLDSLPRAASQAAKALISPVTTTAIPQASGSSLAAAASTTAAIPTAEAISHQPLAQIQNSTTDATRPAKKTKTESPAVVGPRLTEKNLAKAAWLAENPGGSGPDFEAHYKTLTPEEKKNFAAQAKIAQKAARLEKRAKAKGDMAGVELHETSDAYQEGDMRSRG
ncbi:hypothetical protein LshimejAT787_0311830 [Lyophyllum shimeji]|uniref:Uncharacterized protein n=1 Tax=Lyophyllum shimeji TaxID=47721 RepID=A0A9P3UN19_LYOSH|nr:hypothetical protein LshimejAT787_0311830 [Lyophyllum shimeji]